MSGFLICLENPLVSLALFRLAEISDRFRLLSRIWSPKARILSLGRHRSEKKPFPRPSNRACIAGTLKNVLGLHVS